MNDASTTDFNDLYFEDPISDQSPVQRRVDQRIGRRSESEIDAEIQTITRRVHLDDLAKRKRNKTVRVVKERHLRDIIAQIFERMISERGIDMGQAERERLQYEANLELASTVSEIQRLQAELDASRAECDTERERGNDFARRLTHLEAVSARAVALESELASERGRIALLEERVADVEALDGEIAGLRSTAHSVPQVLPELSVDDPDLAAVCYSCDGAVSVLRAGRQALAHLVHDLQNEREARLEAEARADATAGLEARLNERTAAADRARADLERSAAEAKGLHARIDDLQRRLEDAFDAREQEELAAESLRSQIQAEHQRATAAEAELARVQAQLDQGRDAAQTATGVLRRQQHDLSGALKRAEAEARVERNAREQAELERASLQARLEQSVAERAALAKDLAQREEQLVAARAAVESARTEAQAIAQADIGQRDHRIQELSSELAATAADGDRIREQIDRLEQQRDGLAAHSAADQARIQALVEERDHLRDELERLQEALAAHAESAGVETGREPQTTPSAGADGELERRVDLLQGALLAAEGEAEQLAERLAFAESTSTLLPLGWAAWTWHLDRSTTYALVDLKGRICCLRHRPSGWESGIIDPTVQGRAARYGSVVGFAPRACQHCFFVDTDGGLHELWTRHDRSGWYHEDLGQRTGSPQVAGRPAVVDVAGRTCVVYCDSVGDLQVLGFRDGWAWRPLVCDARASATDPLFIEVMGDDLAVIWVDVDDQLRRVTISIAALP